MSTQNTVGQQEISQVRRLSGSGRVEERMQESDVQCKDEVQAQTGVKWSGVI